MLQADTKLSALIEKSVTGKLTEEDAQTAIDEAYKLHLANERVERENTELKTELASTVEYLKGLRDMLTDEQQTKDAENLRRKAEQNKDGELGRAGIRAL